MKLIPQLKKFYAFLQEDTLQSWIVSLILIILFIKLIFFPVLSLITNTTLPLVVIESCSLYHESYFENWWDSNGLWYKKQGITKTDFSSFPFKNGLNKGDIILVIGKKNYQIGDIIIFNPNPGSTTKHPIIHRIVSAQPISTKGDHNSFQFTGSNSPQNLTEIDIAKEQIVGKAAFRIPLIGWAKLIFFEPSRLPYERGICR